MRTCKVEYVEHNYSHVSNLLMTCKWPTCFSFLLNIYSFPLLSPEILVQHGGQIKMKTSIPWFATFLGQDPSNSLFGVTPFMLMIFSSCFQRDDSMLPFNFVFLLERPETDMHCSVNSPGRPPLVPLFPRSPYVTFWCQNRFWCNYWQLAHTLQTGNAIPFLAYHCKLQLQ